MSYEKVKEYFDSTGSGVRIVILDHIGDTVEHAVKAIGCEPARIAQTMSFLVDGKPILIVMTGNVKVNNTKYKACYL